MSQVDRTVHPYLMPDVGIKARYTRNSCDVRLEFDEPYFDSFEALSESIAREAAELTDEVVGSCRSILMVAPNLWDTAEREESKGIIDILLCLNSLFPTARRLTVQCGFLGETVDSLDLSQLTETVENVGLFTSERHGPPLNIQMGPSLRRLVVGIGRNNVQSVAVGASCEFVVLPDLVGVDNAESFYVHQTVNWATLKPYRLE